MKWLNFFKRRLNHRLAKERDEKEALFLDTVLATLFKHECAVNIQFYRFKTPFLSTVLYVDPAHRFILMDEINHDEGHNLALQGESFVIKAQCGEDFVVFEGQVHSVQSFNGHSCYRVTYPKAIAHSKRRDCPRLPINHNNKIDLFIAPLPRFKAFIKDVSMLGVSICIPKHLRNVVHTLLENHDSRLIFQQEPTLSFAFSLKHYRHDFENGQLILGCQFEQLDNTRLKVLAKMMNPNLK
ncbi:flagellar brake protein [Candidatus Berkiella aquae]|uniref:Flagellar brake protein n=1 Tax=Candidatus Berkiella aquae TaxID=295108 RepID=A0A0Q9YLJ3_9GAMM|nr:flagellar brake protein [Candidatus Berkiella aquae]MCS5711451.1 flagellar brake protein [Candidatus Berkiella aquae]